MNELWLFMLIFYKVVTHLSVCICVKHLELKFQISWEDKLAINYYYLITHKISAKNCTCPGSNHIPQDYEPDALTTGVYWIEDV